MGKFRDYLYSLTNYKKEISETDETNGEFQKRINSVFLVEAFDTSHKILKVERGNPDFYYLDIADNKYKIFIEKASDSNKDLHIGFEVYNSVTNEWDYKGITNELKTAEVLGLFGTILVILKSYRFNSIMFCSSENKKFRAYVRMMGRLGKEFDLDLLSHDGYCITAKSSKNTLSSKKFKYKK